MIMVALLSCTRDRRVTCHTISQGGKDMPKIVFASSTLLQLDEFPKLPIERWIILVSESIAYATWNVNSASLWFSLSSLFVDLHNYIFCHLSRKLFSWT